MSNHAPLPWHGYPIGILSAEGKWVVSNVPDHLDRIVSDTDVDFIVRAVNSHDDLLGIVKDILPEYHDDYADGRRCDECGTEKATPEQTQCDVPGCWYVRIREAIAKAEGTADA